MLTKTNDAIKASKATRRRAGDGIELQLFDWMKLLFRVQQPAYHGGKLIGNCIKMTTNAYQMFTRFATILKHSKNDDCRYTDAMINKICADFAQLSVLWVGTLSLASKVPPRSSDIELFKRYVRAATFMHQAMPIDITHKVHLMWAHVASAMKIPGGLG